MVIGDGCILIKYLLLIVVKLKYQQLSDEIRNMIQILHGIKKTRSRTRGGIHYNLKNYIQSYKYI